MKKRIIQLIPLLVIWAMIIACNIQNPLSPSATQTPYVITATPISGDPGVVVESETPDNSNQNPVEPTPEQPQPVATDTVVVQPNPGNQVAYGPGGIMVYQDIEGMVTVFDSYGNQLGIISIPGFSDYGPGNIYAYGLDINDISSLQVYYFSHVGSTIKKVTNGVVVTDLVPVEFMAKMKGFSDSPYFLVGKGYYTESGLATELLAYDFSDGVNSQSYGETVSMESHVYSPMMIHGNNGIPSVGYYTNEAYGIGGDIIYPVNYGLYHLDLATGVIHWLFTDEYSPSSISPDATLAAVIQRDASGIGGVSIYQLYVDGATEIVTYDLLMGQDRGAGYAFISPDNQKVAFMQAGGHMMADPNDFHSMLCHADIIAGAQATCIPATQLVVSSVAYPNSTAQPLGWLNNHELLYDAYTFQEPQHTLRVLDANNGSVRDFASGRFLGFVY